MRNIRVKAPRGLVLPLGMAVAVAVVARARHPQRTVMMLRDGAGWRVTGYGPRGAARVCRTMSVLAAQEAEDAADRAATERALAAGPPAGLERLTGMLGDLGAAG